MKTQDSIKEYIDQGDFFAPDYDRDNDVLLAFKEANEKLTEELVIELVQILNEKNDEWYSKYFVADLLYYYDSFDQALMAPMLQTAINYRDPSFNRIFLRPCLSAFGARTVVHWLSGKFKTANLKEKLGISSLVYWLNVSGADTTELRYILTIAAEATDNIVELYHYKLALPIGNRIFKEVPDDAIELSDRIKGNKEYERLLYDELGWTRK